jgi:hypothetical protein
VHALQRYVAHLGKADRYDELMSMTYVELIHRRMCEKGDAGGWGGVRSGESGSLSGSC